jgi:hypothetical protein
MVIAVGMTVAGASIAHAQQTQALASTDFVPQQVVVATPAPAANLKPADAPVGMTRAQSGLDAAKSNAVAAPGAGFVDNSTRNTLAIIGAVVVVIALVAFLM